MSGSLATPDTVAERTLHVCAAEADGDPVGAASTHGPGCDLTLVCRDGRLAANRCVLCRASSVLRQTLRLALPTPGELQLPADASESWQTVLGLLSLEIYPLQLVNVDNVAALLVLADKYDIPLVRGACAHFLHIHTPQMSLGAPLSSPSNVVTAASLMSTYCSTHPALEQYGATVRQRLDAELAPLRRVPAGVDGPAVGGHGGHDPTVVLQWHLDVLRLVDNLEGIIRTEEYVHSVAGEVQFTVSGALLSGLRHLASRPPPLCARCNQPLQPGTDAFHADCAHSHFASAHTKGCRLCGVPMAPHHARFCNTCAYKKK